MEILISAGIYILVFGAVAVIALVPAVIAYFVSKKKLGKGWSYFAGLVVVLCILASLSQKPILWYTQDCEQSLSEEQEASVRSVSGGAYSMRAPLIAILLLVEERQEEYVAWTEYYFPFGQREMELSGEDGFNCIKNLFPW